MSNTVVKVRNDNKLIALHFTVVLHGLEFSTIHTHFAITIRCLYCLKFINGKRRHAFSKPEFKVSGESGRLSWNSVIDSPLWRCLWPTSVNNFFLFLLHCVLLLFLPWVRISLSQFLWLVLLSILHLHPPSITFSLTTAPCLPCLPLFSLD